MRTIKDAKENLLTAMNHVSDWGCRSAATRERLTEVMSALSDIETEYVAATTPGAWAELKEQHDAALKELARYTDSAWYPLLKERDDGLETIRLQGLQINRIYQSYDELGIKFTGKCDELKTTEDRLRAVEEAHAKLCKKASIVDRLATDHKREAFRLEESKAEIMKDRDFTLHKLQESQAKVSELKLRIRHLEDDHAHVVKDNDQLETILKECRFSKRRLKEQNTVGIGILEGKCAQYRVDLNETKVAGAKVRQELAKVQGDHYFLQQEYDKRQQQYDDLIERSKAREREIEALQHTISCAAIDIDGNDAAKDLLEEAHDVLNALVDTLEIPMSTEKLIEDATAVINKIQDIARY